MRNTILKKVLAFALSLTLMITMAPIIPGAAAKASAAELLPAPTITIDANGVATCTEVEGASAYSWEISDFDGKISPGGKIDIPAELTKNSKGPGCYTLTIYAEDSNGQVISDTATAKYDARIIADTFVADSTFKAPVYGESLTKVYKFDFTSEVNAGVSDSMGAWYKKVDGEWKSYEGTVFTEGTYYYSNQLRLDKYSGTGSTHRLPNDRSAINVTINGEKWTISSEVRVFDTYSYTYMNSPEYVVKKIALDLVFEDSADFDIKNVYQNRAIGTKSVKAAVIGGEEPYTFSKASGPNWLNVSSDGTISGTPDVIGKNEDLVVRVTDNKGVYKEITIDVANTLMNPADRIVADTFVADSTFKAPVYGESLTTVYDFTFTSEVNADVPDSMGAWYKKVDGEWVKYEGSQFTEGTYYYSNQLRLDGNSGTGSTHRLPNDSSTINVTINGEKWAISSDTRVYDTYSYTHMASPEYEVRKESPEATISTTNYTYDGKAKTPSVTVKNAAGATLKNGTDYTVSYASGRKNVGSYKVTVTFKGDKYIGSKFVYFNINPKGTSISKLYRAKKAFTVKWKKQSAKMATSTINGYQIRYSTSSKMTNAKYKTVKGYKSTSKKITKLSAKKKYYVQVRTYKTVSGKTYYSSWSSIKSVKTK